MIVVNQQEVSKRKQPISRLRLPPLRKGGWGDLVQLFENSIKALFAKRAMSHKLFLFLETNELK
jgi:hypothetical protein